MISDSIIIANTSGKHYITVYRVSVYCISFIIMNYSSNEVNGPAVAAILTIEMVCGFIANGIVLVITITQRKSWAQPSTIFFTSLILAHLVMLLLYLPFFIISSAAGEWIFGNTLEEKRATCSFAAYMVWYGAIVISMTLAAISFDRFLFIVKPNHHKTFMKPWVALCITISIWLLAALLNSTPLYGLGEFGYSPYGTCVPLWDSNKGYVFFMLTVFAFTVAIIIITSVWTLCFTRNFLIHQSEIAGSSVYVSKKKRLFGIFGAMFIVYVICISPGFIVGFLSQFVDLPEEIYVAMIICFVAITVANPLVQSYFRIDTVKCIKYICQKIKVIGSSDYSDTTTSRVN